jgi:gluconolactonase
MPSSICLPVASLKPLNNKDYRYEVALFDHAERCCVARQQRFGNCAATGRLGGTRCCDQDPRWLSQMDGQLVSIDLTSKQITTLADKYQGNRFNACNDLVIDKLGGIYFTDPRYNAPDPWPQEKEAFYYRSADGDVARLGDNLTAPNGIGLSPDEKTLYVIPSMGSEMMAYEVKQPGVLGTGRVLCRLQQVGDATNGGGDGMALDVQGNLYITSSAGIQVFSPAGKLLGIIAVPETPANCAFGGEDRKTLFITARTSLYRCTVPVAGLIPRSE